MYYGNQVHTPFLSDNYQLNWISNMKTKTALIFIGFALLSISAGAEVCWKATQTRGVGTVPGECKPKNTKSGLLCYPDCKPGFYNVAGVCWQRCPAGFRDDGAFCRKAEYGRGAGYAAWHEANCKKDNPQGCEMSGLIWYPKCAPGYSPAGCCICKPNSTCPPGMKSVAGSCQKNSYVVQPITPNCGASKVYDTGLCYKTCGNGYDGIGPVCWGKCPPAAPVDCGAMCGTTAMECAKSIFNQIASVGKVLVTVASNIATAGGAAASEAALEAAASSVQKVAKNVLKELGKQILTSGKNLAQELREKGLSAATAQQFVQMAKDPVNFDYKSFIKSVDVTGLSSIIKAFNLAICEPPR